MSLQTFKGQELNLHLKKHNRRTTAKKIIIGNEICGFTFFSKRENFDCRDLISIILLVYDVSEETKFKILDEIKLKNIKRTRKIRNLLLKWQNK